MTQGRMTSYSSPSVSFLIVSLRAMLARPLSFSVKGKLDLLTVKKYNRDVGKGRRRYMPKKQRGRPVTCNPKSVRIDVRLTTEESKMLDDYCQSRNVSRPQGLRDGIKALHAR